jgi:dGTPase
MDWTDRLEPWRAQLDDARDGAATDYSRVIHSASFRRLQGKTQILNLGDSDFYRTRLTHSLEVAQIAGGIARQFEKDYADHPARPFIPDLSMIQAVGMTHDLGHPPFGHGGEVALNFCMREAGGFEGNGQTLRILSRLEKFSKDAGANLMRRTLLGVLKYPVPYSRAMNEKVCPALKAGPEVIRIIDRAASKPPKCYMDCEQDVVDWILAPLGEADRELFTKVLPQERKHHKPLHKSFDCSIMDVADDIGFGIHDLEDALALGLVTRADFEAHVTEEKSASFLASLKEKYAGEFGNNVHAEFLDRLFGTGDTRKRCISRMVHHLVTHCVIETKEEFEQPLIRYRAVIEEGPAAFLEALKDLVREVVIRSPGVQHLEFKGQGMVVAVFEALYSEPKSFLPRTTYEAYERASDGRRVICDHVAGMTDAFLMRTYERLFSPRMGSVFDRL